MIPSRRLKSITGRHFGESKARDDRLKRATPRGVNAHWVARGCGSDTCGTDKLKKSVDPIVHFSNCLIWDSLFYFDGTVLYPDCFNVLKAQYEQAEDTKTGSLRLGCFMCPVISLTTINQNLENGLIDRYAVEIRLLLEQLREAKRINNPRTKKRGAIYVADRRYYWDKLSFYFGYLLKHNWIEPSDIVAITKALKSDYAYPPTYSKEWIDNQHGLLKAFR